MEEVGEVEGMLNSPIEATAVGTLCHWWLKCSPLIPDFGIVDPVMLIPVGS